MSTTSITFPKSKFSYFRFNTTGNANSGYENTFKNNTTMYIGQKATGAPSVGHAGVNCGSFGTILHNLPDISKISKITSIQFTIKTAYNTEGYNGCIARIEYIGTQYNNYPGLWKVGGSGEYITLLEDKTNTFTTSDPTTCENFLNLIKTSSLTLIATPAVTN